MSALVLGVVLCLAAAGAALFTVVALPAGRVPLARRQVGPVAETGALTSVTDRVTSLADRMLHARGWRLFPVEMLEVAGITMSQGSMLTTVASVTVAATAVGFLLGGLVLGLAMLVVVPIGTRVVVKNRISRRRKAFAVQLDETMQMFSSALKAGHSLPRAVDVVARESATPTSDELQRLVNESRLGRDFVAAMRATAARMESEDFAWVAQAVEVQRDTGGNLSEVLDRVGATIRERNEVKELVKTLSAEGRMSMYVLMALPIFVGGGYSLMNPGYMAPLFTTTIGLVLLAISTVMYVIGGVWMRKITTIEV